MKIFLRIMDFGLTFPFFISGFLWVQIRCSFYLGQKAGVKYGIYVNITESEIQRDKC